MNLQRHMIGLAALVCLLTGVILLAADGGRNSSVSGILIRVGLMLAAFWLAFPTLKSTDSRGAVLMTGTILALVWLAAVRRTLFVTVFALAVVAIAANWILRRLAQSRP